MTSADSHPLLQEPKPKSSTLKKVVVAAIALSFVCGSIAGTVANGRGPMSLIDTPSDDTAPAQDPAPAPAQEPAQEPITEDPGSNGGCPPAGSTTEEDCKAAGCTWAPGVYPADVTTNGGICIPTPADPNMPKIKDCHHHEYVSVWKSTSVSGAPDNSSLSHFSAIAWPRRFRRAVRNRHHYAIEQASRRRRGGRRGYSGRTRQ